MNCELLVSGGPSGQRLSAEHEFVHERQDRLLQMRLVERDGRRVCALAFGCRLVHDELRAAVAVCDVKLKARIKRRVVFVVAVAALAVADQRRDAQRDLFQVRAIDGVKHLGAQNDVQSFYVK